MDANWQVSQLATSVSVVLIHVVPYMESTPYLHVEDKSTKEGATDIATSILPSNLLVTLPPMCSTPMDRDLQCLSSRNMRETYKVEKKELRISGRGSWRQPKGQL